MNVFPVYTFINLILRRYFYSTYDDWQPLFEDDVLVLSNIDLPRFLIDSVIRPPRVELCQLRSESVVFSHEESVEDNQVQLLVDSEVSSEETIFSLAATSIATIHLALLFPGTGGKITMELSSLRLRWS